MSDGCYFIFFSRKNSKVQKRGKVNLIGRLQLSTEKAKQEENDGIVALRILRIQVSTVYVCGRVDINVSLFAVYTVFVRPGPRIS